MNVLNTAGTHFWFDAYTRRHRAISILIAFQATSDEAEFVSGKSTKHSRQFKRLQN